MSQPESVADFKHRIAVIMRERETGKRYSIIGASRRPAWCCDAPSKSGGSGQQTIQQDDSTGIVERPKTVKPTKKGKNQ
jgi:hypothetical protein